VLDDGEHMYKKIKSLQRKSKHEKSYE